MNGDPRLGLNPASRVARRRGCDGPEPALLCVSILLGYVRLVVFVVEVDVEGPQVLVQTGIVDRQQVRRAPVSL